MFENIVIPESIFHNKVEQYKDEEFLKICKMDFIYKKILFY